MMQTVFNAITGESETVEWTPPTVDPVAPLTLPIPVEAFWLAADDLFSLTKHGVMTSTMSDQALTEAEKFDAMTNMVVQVNYRRYDENVIRLSTALGYPAEQMDSLWVFVIDHYG